MKNKHKKNPILKAKLVTQYHQEYHKEEEEIGEEEEKREKGDKIQYDLPFSPLHIFFVSSLKACKIF